MAVSPEQAQNTRPLHLVLRCLYNADHKLTYLEIGQMTQLPDDEVRAAVKLLQQHERAVIDQDERIWLVTNNPEATKHESPAVRSRPVVESWEKIDSGGDHSPVPFRDPPEVPNERSRSLDEAALQGWRPDLIRRPDDAAELARIQRSLIETLRELDTPPAVLQALDRIARLLEKPTGEGGR